MPLKLVAVVKKRLHYSTSPQTLPKSQKRLMTLFSVIKEGHLILSVVLLDSHFLNLSPRRLLVLHGVVVVVGGGRRVLVLLHGSLGGAHGCLLGCLLHMGVLPGAGGPLLLGLAQAATAAAVKVVHLKRWSRGQHLML